MPYAAFESLLKRMIGLDAASIGPSAVTRAVQMRLEACHLKTPQEYLEHLQTSETERQELFDAVVVPETWFFRDREAFAAMTRLVQTEWLPKHSEGLLRLLSLPCCTGEEPYSMAMALIDAGLPTSRFSMDAIDISLRALEQARKGVYSRNSFRGTETDFRNRYFKADGQEYRLTEAVRSQVRFRQGNLIDAGLLQSTEAYDMIYCRNLLIYFDADTQKRAVQALTRLLAPHGYLFLGPSETSLPPREDFVPVKIPLAFVFQKVDAAAEAEEKGSRQPAGRAVTAMPADFRKKSRVSTSLRTHMPVRKETTAPQSNLPGFSLDEARRLADAGSLEEATRLCEEHLRDSGPSAQAWFLLGLIRDAAGDGAEAMTAYRKALYLDPNHDEALIHLALLLEKRKEAGGAKLLYERARRITQQSRQP